MIYQLKEPKYKTDYYHEAIASGQIYPCEELSELKYKSLKCPNCGMHIGEKTIGADFYQPFLCPKCKGVFLFDLRYFMTSTSIGNGKEKWQKELGICP